MSNDVEERLAFEPLVRPLPRVRVLLDLSPDAAAVTARMLGKLVHVGRANTWARARDWADLADSYDGSGISRDPRDE